jgi:Flp pilus assembly protein TadG
MVVLDVSNERGQAGIEMLIVLLVLAPLLLGGFSLAQGYSARHALENSTAVAARQIALNPNYWASVLAGVQTTVDNSLLGGTGSSVTCTVRDAWGAAVDPTTLSFGSRFSVTCGVPFQSDIPFVSTAPRTLTAVHNEVMERYP